RVVTPCTPPRRKTLTGPSAVPTTVARSAAAGARISISRPPSITRANESRPRRSGPNQWSGEGAARGGGGSRGERVARICSQRVVRCDEPTEGRAEHPEDDDDSAGEERPRAKKL